VEQKTRHPRAPRRSNRQVFRTTFVYCSLFEADVSVASISTNVSLTGQNRWIAEREDCGDNLSVRFYIQNSISLTIAGLQRMFIA
jgi:hypothetical protein